MRKKICALFIAAFCAKLVIAVFLDAYHTPEVFEYEAITDNILKGNGFLYNFRGVPYKTYTQPFYPVLTAIVYFLTNHSHEAMIIIQCLFSSLASVIIYFIALRLTGKKEAFLAAVLTAFHPGLSVYSIFKLHPLVFDTFFYLLSAGLILRFMTLPNIKNALLTGPVIGFALLSRSTILIFVIFSIIYLFFMLKNLETRTRIAYLSIICLTAIAAYSPWVVRNYKVFHSFVFMQTGSGENLWKGNNNSASGTTVLASGDSIFIKMPEQMRQDLSRLDELDQVKYYKGYFLKFISERPHLFARLFFKKFYYFWWFSPSTGVFYQESWLRFYTVYYSLIILFAIRGIFRSLNDRRNYSALCILLAYMLSISLIHAVVNIDTRHRWTVEPIIIIFAVIGFSDIYFFFKEKLPFLSKYE
jgi:4-amino-4-deoxy-L-arabinose transferase-like glycosyltransferase